MGFCTDEQAKRSLATVPLLEKAIVESGVILLKKRGGYKDVNYPFIPEVH